MNVSVFIKKYAPRLLLKISDHDEVVRRLFPERQLEGSVLTALLNNGIQRSLLFSFENFRCEVLAFVETQRQGSVYLYKYSNSTGEANLYSSVFACLIRFMLRNFDKLSEKDCILWLDYFQSFQSADDGLFYDPSLKNQSFDKEDWWGARHLAAIMPAAFEALGGRPQHDFYFLEPFYDKKYVIRWLESRDWKNRFDFVSNEIMNYGVLLQYSRDAFQNKNAGNGVWVMFEWLVNEINPKTGLWGEDNIDDSAYLSKAVQCAYHIWRLFFYDGIDVPFKEKIIDNILKTQNKLGGYGVSHNSSACEDIDSIDPLIRFSLQIDYKREEIKRSLLRALPWILSNMNDDGGFVFRREAAFIYGHKEMSSDVNESSLFATWFRVLSLGYLINYLQRSEIFYLTKAPGY